MNLKQITKKDQLELKKLYFDSIVSIDERIYTQEQKRAWASQAWDSKIFDLSINQGKGWLINSDGKNIGFATRYPKNRISLLYCKGDSQRKGYGTIGFFICQLIKGKDGLSKLMGRLLGLAQGIQITEFHFYTAKEIHKEKALGQYCFIS